MKSRSTLAWIVLAISPFASATAAERPNILWLTSEDNGISWVSCYGGTNGVLRHARVLQCRTLRR